MAFILSSDAFRPQQPIPKSFTCDGADQSPALSWQGAPPGTKGFALIMDDPDAPSGTFTHWVMWDIPADAAALPPGVTPSEKSAGGAHQGRNGFGRIGYGGPCPPPGRPHHYSFRLYALSQAVSLRAGASKEELLAAMQGKILGTAELVGTYVRSRS